MELLSLPTVDASPPKSRLKDANTARAILQTLRSGDLGNSVMRARVQGMIDLNAPFDEQDLIDMGQADRSNVNWGEAKARIIQKRSLYYDLLFSADKYVNIETLYGKRSKRPEYGQIISEEVHRMLKSLGSRFLWNMMFSQTQMVIHGIGPLFWRGALDWRVRAMKRRCVLVPQGMASNEDDIEFCMVVDLMYPDELWMKIRNEEVAERSDWKPDAVRDAIVNSCVPQDKLDQNRTNNYEWIQEQIKDNAFGIRYSDGSQVVEICHCYVREFDGSFSHHIFAERSEEDFIYSKLSKYNNLREALCMMFGDIGNGDFASVRGDGLDVYRFGEASNRFYNSMIDGGIVGNSVFWNARTAGDIQKLQNVEIGPNRIIPDGLTYQQIPMAQNLESSMKVASFFKMVEMSNLGTYQTADSTNSGKRKTAKEVEFEQSEKSQLQGSSSEHYLLQADAVYTQMVERACNLNLLESDPGGNLALEMQRRCVRRGVPRQALTAISSVMATRTIGNGSASARAYQLGQLQPFMPEMPSRKRKVYVRQSIAAICQNQGAAELYGPDLDDKETPGNDASIAAGENTAFMVDGDVIYNPDHDAFIHATVHLKFGHELIDKTQQQGLDPRQAAHVLDQLLPHTNEHVQSLEDDPTRKQEYEKLLAALMDLAKQTDMVKRVAAQIDEQEKQQQDKQQPQGQPDPALVKVEHQNQLNDIKAKHQMELKTKKQEFEQQLQAQRAEFEKAIKDAETANKLHNANQV